MLLVDKHIGNCGVSFREVYGNDGTFLRDAPVWVEQETKVGGNSDAGAGEMSIWSCRISTPGLFGYYPEVRADGRTRVGGRQLAPPIQLPTSFPWSGNFS